MESLQNVQRIHIQWSIIDPAALNEVGSRIGLYAVFGPHQTNGIDTLLYIGKTEKQDLTTRSKQHGFDNYSNSHFFKIIYGELKNINGNNDNHVNKNEFISISEELMIFSHQPAWNSKNIASIKEDKFAAIQIYNWGNYYRLLPEVSGDRWTGKYWNTDNYNFD